MKPYINKLIILLSLFIFCHNYSQANPDVTINDTIISTDFVTLPVLGKTEEFSLKKVEFYFLISWVSFDLLEVVINPNYGLFNSVITEFDKETHILKISSDYVKAHFTGTLFDLKLQIHTRNDFFGPWETFQITPLKIITIDSDNKPTLYELNSPTAIISLDYIKAIPTFYESVSLNYPNPFDFQTDVFFSIHDPTKIKMQLYNPSGALLQTIPHTNPDAPYLHYVIYNSNNQPVVSINDDWTNFEFQKGIYKINFRVNRELIAIGIYRLILITNKNKYIINLVFAR